MSLALVRRKRNAQVVQPAHCNTGTPKTNPRDWPQAEQVYNKLSAELLGERSLAKEGRGGVMGREMPATKFKPQGEGRKIKSA